MSFIPPFREMIECTPALRAAWLELHDRLAAVARDELAALAERRPPRPGADDRRVRALAGLAETGRSTPDTRHIPAGLRGDELRQRRRQGPGRGRSLLETGLWSFNLLARCPTAARQALEAARAAEEARVQVLKALKQARAALEAGAGREPRPRPVTQLAVLGAGGVGGFLAAALAAVRRGRRRSWRARRRRRRSASEGLRSAACSSATSPLARRWRPSWPMRSTSCSSPPRRRGSTPPWSGSGPRRGWSCRSSTDWITWPSCAGASARSGWWRRSSESSRTGRRRATSCRPVPPAASTWRARRRRWPRSWSAPASRPGSATARPMSCGPSSPGYVPWR